MQALFRVVEVDRGSIFVDGMDLQAVPLHTLRSCLAIIPQVRPGINIVLEVTYWRGVWTWRQDPVIFVGNLRYQLDPFQQYDDVAIWSVLEKVNMAGAVREMAGGLNELIAENGENLSQGQKQLLCIARAFLRKAKILIMVRETEVRTLSLSL